MNKVLMIIMLLSALCYACRKDKPSEEEEKGKIVFRFVHLVDGQAVVYDTMKYTNTAGNHYMITDMQYFISDVVLHASDGSKKMINEWQDIYYVDTYIPSTFEWQVYDAIPPGHYDSISFTFGINKEKNKNGLFVNPPEVNMFWPDFLGGGFHYLKLNGRWKTQAATLLPFNFHTGIGADTIGPGQVVFVHNYFNVNLKNSSFTVNKGRNTVIEIVMNIESWFHTPHVWDWDSIGGAIMENQSAMLWARENGFDVFTIGEKTEEP
ncbi:MAG TPA: hypothetical protein P5531_05280 [Bacteroidales bacterium]|nr:hypothetical protein [Bacteroidales bacterium]HSA42818.1 hypothetical protein [Bacteroidales bacterium]